VRILSIILTSILILSDCIAQEEYINFDIWTSEKTNIGSQVIDFHQDHEGYIWLSTFNGVVRFDGSDFIHLEDLYPESAQITTDHISCVRKDIKDNLWIGTIEQGLFIIDKVGRFHEFDDFVDKDDQLKEYRIEHIISIDSFLFIKGRTGLTSYKYQDRKYHKIDNITSMDDAKIKEIVKYKDDILFASKSTIYSLNNSIDKTDQFSNPKLFLDIEGELYCRSLDRNGTLIYRYQDEDWKEITTQPFRGIKENRKYTWDYQDRLWAVKYNDNVICYDFKNQKWLIEKEKKNHNLTQGKIRDVLVDNSGTVWIGSEVISLLSKRQDIRSIKLPIENGSSTRNFLINEDEIIYNTERNGIYKLNNGIQNINTNNSDLKSQKFLKMGQLEDDKYGVLHSKGFQTLDSSGNFSGLVKSKGSNRSLCTLGGYYWIGGVSKILKVDPETLEVTKYPYRSYNISQNIYINGLTPKSKTELYVGSNLKQLHVFDIEKEEFTPAKSKMDPLKIQDGCNHISINKYGELALATDRGLYIYDGQEYESLVYKEYFLACGWAEDSIVIASSRDKIYKVNPKTKDISIISQDNGLLNNQFMLRAVDNINSEICFGGNVGIDCIDVNTPSDSLSALLLLESIRVNNDRQVDIQDRENISLDKNTKHVEIKLNQIFTKSQSNSKILYRNDSRSEWQALANNTLTLDNPRRGKHIFEFKSEIPNYVGTNETLYLEFEIPIPWYKQVWFLILTSLFSIGLISWLISRYQNKKKEELVEAARLKADISELRLQALSGQMNPHFTFNALNSILQMINEQDVNSASIYIQKFSRMLRFVLEYSDQSWVALDKEIKFLENYLTLEKMRFNDTFDYKIEMYDKTQAALFLIPPFFIQPKIENALKHGIRELDNGGHIHVKFKIVEDSIIISIIDNGIGISASKAKSKLHNSNTNKGIELTQKRLNQLRKLGYSAGMNISDRIENKNIIGTQVDITLPFKKSSSK